jgi:serine/threonine protein phosphatase PrpC
VNLQRAAVTAGLRVSIGQHSQAGPHPVNQDFFGAVVPSGAALHTKGVALALADGIGSSRVSHVASAAAVHGFLADYYATSEAWSVRRAAQRVIEATNSWLSAQTRRGEGRFDKDRGHVCAFSALVFRGREAHLFHVGDTRVCRVHERSLEPLSEEHRLRLDDGAVVLGRALGIGPGVEIDHACWPVAAGETYLLATDGAWEWLDAQAVQRALQLHGSDLQAAAEALVAEALARGSGDNATVQLARVDELPPAGAGHLHEQREGLALPPPLAPRMSFEGCTIVRELQIGARSHVWLAVDDASGAKVVLKTPPAGMRDDAEHLDRFVLEEWVARRVDSPHVVRAAAHDRPRSHLFVAMEYIEGQTLAQWMTDHPRPPLQVVRGIVEQLAKGLQALHRKEMLHQDLRPENVMIDVHGTVKLLDLGGVHVAGLAGGLGQGAPAGIAGSLQYTAPEYFLGHGGTVASDLFALGVITFQLLAGQLPYGLQVARIRAPGDLHRLQITPLRALRPDLPAWVEAVLRKALHPQPARRQEALSEFVHDLHSPGPQFQAQRLPPLVERHPVAFWRATTVVLLVTTLVLLWLVSAGPRAGTRASTHQAH